MSTASGSEIRPVTETPRTTPVTSLEELFRCWRLDAALRRHYDRSLGIEHLYPWQSRCLAEHGVAEGTRNLLYFAPTSGGKTMVAELLLLLRVMGLPLSQELACDHPQGKLEMERQKGAAMEQVARRVVFVLPFVSMVTEKVKHLQKVVAPYNRGKPKRKRIKVKALYGSKGGGWNSGTQVAVCTIEKANALINRMAAANELHELCCLVVDELHMIGEDGRGQTLELLLSKVVRANRIAHHHKNNSEGPEVVTRGSTAGALTVSRDGRPESSQSMSSGQEDEVGQCGKGPGARRIQTQIIGMSATLSNGAELAAWLGAVLHVSDYRPVPLDERVLLGMHVYDKSGTAIRSFSEPAHLETDPDHVVTLCRESCLARDQVIIFCSTKQFCHNCAIKVAKNLMVPASRAVAAQRSALMAQLAKEMSMGVDPILQETIPHGVAFHHAGLADTERSAIEAAFRAGSLRVLAATSTLGAGVNLPAGRVILRNLNAPGGGLSATRLGVLARIGFIDIRAFLMRGDCPIAAALF